jgi:hypothetical protein
MAAPSSPAAPEAGGSAHQEEGAPGQETGGPQRAPAELTG